MGASVRRTLGNRIGEEAMKRSQKVKKEQKRRLSIVLGCIVGAIILTALWGFGSKERVLPRSETPRADLPADRLNPQDIWMTRLEAEEKRLDQKLDYLESVVLEGTKQREQKEAENLELRKEISRLKREVRELPQQIASCQPIAPTNEGLVPEHRIEIIAPPSLPGPLVEYVMDEPESSVSNVATSVPAGATVRAVLVSALDAPVGIHCSSDPQPVKLRVLDSAHMAKGVEVDLKGAVLIGSGYADLSSERVYIRLERMTQVAWTGEFVETQVAGYVSGEDGRYGMRGTVVDKAGKLVTNAAISGFMSGVNQFLQATVNAQNIRDATRGLPNDIRWDLIKEGGLSGCSNAMETLANYYIEKAEQIQPVIQIQAGRVVDITFTHGAEIGDLHTHDHVREVRIETRREE